MHTSGWFGPSAMPTAWCRISWFVNEVLARRFAIFGVIHMDDQVNLDPAPTSHTAIVCFRRVVKALGLKLKASKEKFPNPLHVALGGSVGMPEQGSREAFVSLPADRADKYQQRMQSVLDSEVCAPAIAAKIGGYIQTVAS